MSRENVEVEVEQKLGKIDEEEIDIGNKRKIIKESSSHESQNAKKQVCFIVRFGNRRT
jgi:hypothetical protein